MNLFDGEAPLRARGRDAGPGPSRGRAFVYVLPCRYEDILKIGFSRDPLERFQTLHARWFDYFDVDNGLLIETDTVTDARRLERELGKAVLLHKAPAPLVIPQAAAGHTEWFRGALEPLAAVVETLREHDGYPVHRPVGHWLARCLEERAGSLYAWSANLLEMIHTIENMPPNYAAAPLERTLRNALDAYAALDLQPDGWVSEDVRRWYRENGRVPPND